MTVHFVARQDSSPWPYKISLASIFVTQEVLMDRFAIDSYWKECVEKSCARKRHIWNV